MLAKRTEKNSFTLAAGLFFVATTLGLPNRGPLYAQDAAPFGGVGRVAGKARLEGLFRKPAPLKVNKNRDFCGNDVPNESLLVSPGGGLQNAVIILRGGKTERKENKMETLTLDNRNCAFVPHVQVAPLGSEILLLNSDPILHDAHARLGTETLFNVGLPMWRQVKKRLTREGIVRVECDVLHTWQRAYIVVTSSPYFAVTGETGNFAIERVPAGTYQMEAWHERLGKQSRTVVVKEGRTSGVEVAFSCTNC